MEQVSLGQIAAWCGGFYQGPPELLHRPVADIVTDSRAVSSSCVFAALKGGNTDGHHHAAAALQSGALCCLVERPIDVQPYILVPDTLTALGDIARAYRLSLPTRLLAVTGSAGKTTAKDMLAGVLGRGFSVLKTSGNFNNALGLPLTLFRLDRGHEWAVAELGVNHFHEMSGLGDIARPDAAFYTNIGDAHLEAFHDRDGVLRAKSELLDYIPTGGRVYINNDDEYLRRIRQEEGLELRRYGEAADSDLRLCDIRAIATGSSGRLIGCGADFDIVINAPGRYLLQTAVGAALVALDLGLSPEDIVAGLAGFSPPSGRGDLIETGGLRVIDHSYNANPSSMRVALDSLAPLPGRRVAILGDMYELGENEAALHGEVGAYAAGLGLELVLAVGRLSRPLYEAAHKKTASVYFATAEELLAALPELIEPGDAVLVKASHSLHLEQAVEALKAL